MGFEIVDRRGGNKEVAPEVSERLEAAVATGDVEEINRVSAEVGGGPAHKVMEFKKTVRGEVQKWRNVGYVIVKLPTGPGNELLQIRAVGIRTDEGVFSADYVLPPIWKEGDDFAAEAKKRLDTFLPCSCDQRGVCKFHSEAMPGPGRPGKWLEDDINRLRKAQSEPLPEAIELLMRAAAEKRIVVPGQ